MHKAQKGWLDQRRTKRLAADLAQYSAGATLEACSNLAGLMTNLELANEWVNSFLSMMISAHRAVPLSEPPFAFRASPGFATVQLLKKGRATLTLAAYEPLEAVEEPTSAVFSDRSRRELVLKGAAVGLTHEVLEGGGDADRGANVRTRRMNWHIGDTIETRALIGARHIVRVKRSLLLLQLTREAKQPLPVREVELASGVVTRMASGDKSASQAVMALGVLGALRAYSALDVVHQTALNPDEDPEVRWEAVRQALGMGAVRGMEILETLVKRTDDALSKPATALKEQLVTNRFDLQEAWEKDA
ncbi:MAG: hypothetical protein AAGH57_03595 [Pseudomonadota bacterium]